jgi:hypothetical protein
MSFQAAMSSSDDQNFNTPPKFIECVRTISKSGIIGYDPLTDGHNRTGALCFDTPSTDGMKEIWSGRGLVFANPPYGPFLARAADKFVKQGECMARGDYQDCLVTLHPARIGTEWFRKCRKSANAVCFHAGRFRFWRIHPATGVWGPAVYYDKRAAAEELYEDKEDVVPPPRFWKGASAAFECSSFFWGDDVDAFERAMLMWNPESWVIRLQ